MAPRLIEFIESLDIPGAGFALSHSNTQQITAAFAAGAQASYQVPLAGVNAYAVVLHRVTFSPAMVPGAFTASILQGSRLNYNPTISALVLRDGLDFFVVASKSSPLQIRVTNNSAIAQYYEHVVSGLEIPTESDWKFLMKALDELANKGHSEQVALAALALQKARDDDQPALARLRGGRA